ncbi:hypothetical protein CQS04_12080 [Chryseomicrobium excrementi]|uniref:Uncharacterized protein n=1 Tax=Chryseomicrobium excrementi TaxID=2041346 RepID=A0A2M9EXM5_9BACL|nr:hypothetical protein [Chryseomicrobium excrementi]PJK15965.1 hypothetical protein CQS04_12080 [Chryseomicrobium excrementi]
MKPFKMLTLIALALTLAGLFFEWVQIEFVSGNGLNHWSGIYMLLLTPIALYMVFKEISPKAVLLILFALPLFAITQFIFFAEILNISSWDIRFSLEVVQIGFFISLLAGVVALISYGVHYFQTRKLA